MVKEFMVETSLGMLGTGPDGQEVGNSKMHCVIGQANLAFFPYLGTLGPIDFQEPSS